MTALTKTMDDIDARIMALVERTKISNSTDPGTAPYHLPSPEQLTGRPTGMTWSQR
jgi:hypothetical protein